MKLGLIITAFNRPQYLRQCLESISRADLSQVNTVLIVDDFSDDPDTRRLIDDFDLPAVELIKAFSKENRSIKGSLLFGCDLLFQSCDVVTNLDADAIVRKDFISVLLDLHKTFPDHIKTGFNCLTKNKDGSERHKILTTGMGMNTKRSVGGINMLFDKSQYGKWVRPTLIKSIEQKLNWDDHTCRASMVDGFAIICAVPSVINHIGFESAMGHSAGGEPPDQADDFVNDRIQIGSYIEDVSAYTKMYNEAKIKVKQGSTGLLRKLQLDSVTLIAADDNIQGIIKAADISCKNIEFGAVKLLSSMDSDDPRAIKIRHLGSKEEYSRFFMNELVDYIDTPFFISIQADGYILDWSKFDDDWFNYDFIGSPWEWYTDGMQVGNGAASFRSRRLHEIVKDDPKIFPTNDHLIKQCQEDHNIARIYRPYLEATYGIKFAPIEIARRFGIEAWSVKPPGNKYSGQFAFHGKHVDFSGCNLLHKPY